MRRVFLFIVGVGFALGASSLGAFAQGVAAEDSLVAGQASSIGQSASSGWSKQKKGFDYKFYGFVMNVLALDSRKSVAVLDEMLYLYPLDVKLDANGEDLNAVPSLTYNALITRAGVEVVTDKLFNAKTTACVEVDFAGYSGKMGMLRLRHAYVKLDWAKHKLLLGQTWHPFFGKISPSVVSVSTGAPFQPFCRQPQIRYDFVSKVGLELTAAAVWQYQYTSSGPQGSSQIYMKNSLVPELFASIDYRSDNGWLVGAAAHFLSIVPRTSSIVDGKEYKVKERMNSLSYQAYISYTKNKFRIAAKSTLASALDCVIMLGGYAVSDIDPNTGQQEYLPLRNSSTWLNITYGDRWRPSFFVGYTKNLGAAKDLFTGISAGAAGASTVGASSGVGVVPAGDATPESGMYGRALDIDQLLTFNASISYMAKKDWSIGLEYLPSTAWYGNILTNGSVDAQRVVTNHRVQVVATYYF